MTLMPSLLALSVGFATAFFMVWYMDQIARRVAPELVSGVRRAAQSKLPAGFYGWLGLFGKTLLGVLFMLLLLTVLRGPNTVVYATIAALSAALVYQSYMLRIRPLAEKGATPVEVARLVGLATVWVTLWAWAVAGFITVAHRSGVFS
jgi:hypothetical protein